MTARIPRARGVCPFDGSEFTLETLKKNGGMCGRCAPKGICAGSCGKTFTLFALNQSGGMCQPCYTTHRILQLEQENAELKKTLNNTIAAYASLVATSR